MWVTSSHRASDYRNRLFTLNPESRMRRWPIGIAAALAVVLLGVVGFARYTGVSPWEVFSFLESGATLQLRTTMRPARSDGPRVLVFALDGVGADELRAALARGAMPHVASVLGEEVDSVAGVYEHGIAPKGVLSILPSTTFAAWTSVYTGRSVAEHGVAGNEWFDRESRTFVAPAPVSVQGHGDAVRVFSDSLLHAWIAEPTLFERADVRSYVTLAAQYRGADLLVRPNLEDFAELAVAFAAGVVSGDSDWEAYSELDQSAVGETVAAIDEHGLADLQVIYFPGVDLFTHVADTTLREQQQYLSTVVDAAVGRVLSAYRSRNALDSTYVLFVSDHGHTASLADERHALGSSSEGELESLLNASGFRVRPFDLETDDESYQAVLAYQGAFAYVYLADRSTCPEPGDRCDWQAPPRYQEDVLPVVQALGAATRTGTGAAKLHGAIDLILSREPHGAASADSFRIWNGVDLESVGAYLATNPRPDLLQLETRLAALGSGRFGHRSGDVLLLSRYRAEDPPAARFYFSGRYRSWHGSPSAQDSEILFMLARGASSGTELRTRMEEAVGSAPTQLDITPLILALLGR